MTPLRFHHTLCALFCLLTIWVLSQTSYGGITTLSSVRLISTTPHGLAQRVIPISGNPTQFTKKHIVGPFELGEKGHTYSLEILNHNGGKKLIFRTAQGEGKTLAALRKGTIINALQIMDTDDDQVEFQLLDAEQNPAEPPKKFAKSIVYATSGEPEDQESFQSVQSMIVSPAQGINYLLAKHQVSRNQSQTHSTLLELINAKDESENANLIKELDNIKQGLPDCRNLLMYPTDTLTTKQLTPSLPPNQAILDVSALIPELVDTKVFHKLIIPTQEGQPKQLFTLYSRSDMPELGYLTSPFFVGGSGNFLVPHTVNQQHTSLKGDQYILQIKEDSTKEERIIVLHRLHRPTIEESVLFEPETGKPFVLHLSRTEAFLTNSDNGHTYNSVHFQNPDETFLIETPLDKLAKSIDPVKLVNMVSKWTSHLHTQSTLTKPKLDGRELIECFNGQNTHINELKDNVALFSSPTTIDTKIGFQSSALHTNLQAHPQFPIGGIETGVIEIESLEGQRGHYTVQIRLTSPYSYVATLHHARDRYRSEDYNAAQDQLLFSAHSTALATVTVDYQTAGEATIRMVDSNGSSQSATLGNNLDLNRDKLTLLPIRDETNVYQPNIAACLSLLTLATDGTFPLNSSLQLPEQFVQLQSSLNSFDDTTIYYPSSIVRSIPHKHPWAVRKIVGGLKGAANYAIKKPITSLTVAGAVATGLYVGPMAYINAAGNALLPVAKTVVNATSSYAGVAATTVSEHPFISTIMPSLTIAAAAGTYELGKMHQKRKQESPLTTPPSQVIVNQADPSNPSDSLDVPIPTSVTNKPGN